MPTNGFKLLTTFLAGWLLLSSCNWLFGAANETRYHVDVWRTEAGLPQGSVISMIQTQDGYLWFGTLNGLVRFDGARFTVFDESNTPGLNSSRIVKLFEDSKKNLWIGTETAGAAMVKDGKVISLDFGQGRREGQLVALCEDAIGGVWLYTADGELGRYYDGKVEVWNIPAERFNTTRSLISEKSGLIWVGTDRSLFAINPNEVRGSTSLPRENVASAGKLDFLLASEKEGHWRLVDGFVQKWTRNGVERSWPYPWPGGTIIKSACEDLEGNLVVGTFREGLFWFDAEGKATHISKTEGGLSDTTVLSLHADTDGSLWVGLDGGGLNRLKPQVFQSFGDAEGLTVQSVAEDAEGGLWFSSNNRGIDYWRDDALKHVSSAWGPMNRFNPRAVLVDREQRVWAGTFGLGLFQLQDGLFQRPRGAEMVHREVSAIHQDRAGRIWVGTQMGLACWDERAWKIFTTQEGLSANIVRAIADDAEGNLWIGTERGGLNRLRDGKFTAFQQTNGFPSDNISALYVDAEGVLWVGTFGSGLVRFKNGAWTHYTVRDGLISNGIDYLIEDDQGCLWIGSNTGLMRVRKKALNDFARGETDFVPCRGYGERDGLPASECTLGSQPAAGRTRDGRLWFPTIAGLASVNPAQFKSNTNPPPVVIESVRVEGKEQSTSGLRAKLPEVLTIPAGKEQLEIQYTSLDLTAPNRARFKYRLGGHEADWINVGNSRSVRYSKLPPGEYRFEVTACNEDGVWNEKGSSLAIYVLPPFWRTWWFLAAITLLLLGIIVAIVHYISTQKLQRQLEGFRQQEALEKERARIARDIHDQVGASLTQVSLLGEMVESDKNFPEEVEAHGKQISQTARETSHALDEIVWTVNPSNDTLDGLINYICKHAQEFLAVAGLRYRLEVPSQLPNTPISPETRHNVFLATKEAITNVVRHAHASEVWIRLRIEPRHFILEIEDNGRGLDPTKKTDRNGLRNMRKRMDDIGAKFSIGRGKEGGTIVSLTVPIAN